MAPVNLAPLSGSPAGLSAAPSPTPAGATAAPTGTAPVAVMVRMFPKLSETFVLEELLGLERLGMTLRLYTLAPPTDALVHDAVARVRAPVAAVPAGGAVPARAVLAQAVWALVHRPWGLLQSWVQAGRQGRAGWRLWPRAAWLARRLRLDGVRHLHVHFIAEPADLAAQAAALSGLPFSVSAHAKDIYLSAAPDLRRRLGAARFTVTCTECNRAVLDGVAPGARVWRMYHGIDAQVFHPRQRQATGDTPLLLSVGRLRAKKGHDTLLAACARLQAQGRAVAAEIVGYGEEADRLHALRDELGLAEAVHLRGKLARDGVLAAYGRASVYVQPSRIDADGDRDGIPNVLLEAMAMGLPVVATQVSGIPELVEDGVNGLLVPPDDPPALAQAIARLLDDPALASRLGEAARATVLARFDNDRNLRQLLALLEAPGADHPRSNAA